jgi:protein involved in polysaccharide export with SLBB domain
MFRFRYCVCQPCGEHWSVAAEMPLDQEAACDLNECGNGESGGGGAYGGRTRQMAGAWNFIFRTVNPVSRFVISVMFDRFPMQIRWLTLTLICLLALGACRFATFNDPASREGDQLGETGAGQELASGNYRIVPSDVLEISVFQEEDMSTQQRVSKDGTITFPFLGRVKIGGMTVDQVSSHLTQLLKKEYLVNPQVSVSILTYAPRRFSVLGQVQNPGSFEIPGEEVMTLPAAIAMAGGDTRIGDIKRVRITRVQAGKTVTMKVNAKDPKNRDFEVFQGDVITVPESLF